MPIFDDATEDDQPAVRDSNADVCNRGFHKRRYQSLPAYCKYAAAVSEMVTSEICANAQKNRAAQLAASDAEPILVK